MQVLVTGGAGFIGANLCRHLRQENHSVRVFDDFSTGSANNLLGVDVDMVEGSILDSARLQVVAAGADVVIHLAARGSVPLSVADPVTTNEINVRGTLHVLQCARQNEALVYFSSSSSVYGRNPAMPKAETLRPMPASPYAVSKLAAESYVQAFSTSYGLRTMAFRFFNVYGPLQSPDHPYAAVIPSFMQSFVKQCPATIFGDGHQSRDFTFVDTVCEVLCSAISRQLVSVEPVNLAYGTNTSLRALLDNLEQVVGRPIEREFKPARAGDVKDSRAESTLLRSMFSEVTPVALRKGLQDTWTWFESSTA